MSNSRLFEPGRLGTLTVPNRIVYSPMSLRSTDGHGHYTETAIASMELRAEGGCGLVIAPGAMAWPSSTGYGLSVSIAEDDAIPYMREVARRIKRHGARAALQIGARGTRTEGGAESIAPSAMRFGYEAKIPRELTVEEIEGFVREMCIRDSVYTVVCAVIVASLLQFVLGMCGIGFLANILRVPLHFLVPAVIAVCAIGAYSMRGIGFDIELFVLFGILGFFFVRMNYSISAVMLGMILGKITEVSLVEMCIRDRQYAASLSFEDLPEDVVIQAKRIAMHLSLIHIFSGLFRLRRAAGQRPRPGIHHTAQHF